MLILAMVKIFFWGGWYTVYICIIGNFCKLLIIWVNLILGSTILGVLLFVKNGFGGKRRYLAITWMWDFALSGGRGWVFIDLPII